MTPHDCLDLRVEHSSEINHLTRLKGIRGCDHQHARPGNMRLNENGWLRGIASHGRYTACARLLDEFTILLSHDKRHVALAQRFTDTLANTAITDQHDMCCKAPLVHVRRKFRERIVTTF